MRSVSLREASNVCNSGAAQAGQKQRNATSSKGRQGNEVYRVREHLTEAEIEKLLAALKHNRYGQRNWLIGLLIYRHGLRVPEACDLRWDDIDLTKRTIIARRLKGSTDSSHYLERDEHKALGELWRANAKKGIKSDYVFLNERGQPFGRMGVGRMIKNALASPLSCLSRFTCTCCATSTGYAWQTAEWIHGASSTISGTLRSRIQFATPQCRRSHSRTSGAETSQNENCRDSEALAAVCRFASKNQKSKKGSQPFSKPRFGVPRGFRVPSEERCVKTYSPHPS